MTSTDEISQMIEDCEKRSEKLSEWECAFVDSISDQLRHGRGLTERQVQILEKTWDRVTG